MPKPDFPALLQPGMHRLSIDQLRGLAVDPFPADLRRAELFRKFGIWTDSLTALGVCGTLWIDGSFLTQKENPGDIDCVLWNPFWRDPAAATPDDSNQVAQLLDHGVAEALYDLDFYLERTTPDQVFHREAYWRGILGYCHDRVTAKGFAEIIL